MHNKTPQNEDTEVARERRRKQAPETAPETPAPAKGTHGGARAGAGRPKKVAGGMKIGIYIRCSADQKAALVEHVAGLSAERTARGLPKLELSTWMREIALKHSGNEDLGAAAQAARRAADSIV